MAIGCSNFSKDEYQKESIGWIGLATIDSEGTITVQARSEQEDGTIAHSQFEYVLTHVEYSSIKNHIGELKVGQWKRIPPWND